MNAVYEAAAARRRAVETELTDAANQSLRLERETIETTARQAALIVERDQLDVWLTANEAVLPPPVIPDEPAPESQA